MNKAHASGFLTIVAVQVCTILADQTSPWPAKIAGIVATLVTLYFADREKQRKATVIVLGLASAGVPILTFALTKMHPGALVANLATVALGVFVRLPALMPVPEPTPQEPAKGEGP